MSDFSLHLSLNVEGMSRLISELFHGEFKKINFEAAPSLDDRFLVSNFASKILMNFTRFR